MYLKQLYLRMRVFCDDAEMYKKQVPEEFPQADPGTRSRSLSTDLPMVAMARSYCPVVAQAMQTSVTETPIFSLLRSCCSGWFLAATLSNSAGPQGTHAFIHFSLNFIRPTQIDKTIRS
jgi:hypothetical protein